MNTLAFKSFLTVKRLNSCLTIIAVVFAAVPGFAKSKRSLGSAENKNITFARKIELEKLSKWEIRTAPLALIAQWQTLDVSYRFTENFAMGPSIIRYAGSGGGNMFLPDYSGDAYGFSADYYFRSVMKNTWYLGSHAYKEKYRNRPHATFDDYERDGYRVNAVLGYQIKFQPFNLLIGGGEEYRSYQETKYVDKYSSLGPGPTVITQNDATVSSSTISDRHDADQSH